jgi:hypothetical protein
VTFNELRPFAIAPPLSGVMERSSLPAGVRIMTQESPDEIADDVRRSSLRRVYVEGFSAAGKTTFAARLAHRLGWRHIELDGLSSGVELDSECYADFLDVDKLVRLLDDHRAGAVVEGVCLREVMQRARDVNANPFVVYVARVSAPTVDTLAWHDGLDAEQPDGTLPWLSRAVIRYHRDFQPYADARHILLRIAD